MNGRIRIAVLPNDGDWWMPPSGRFRELQIHVGHVAHIREHPNFGLARLTLDDGLKLSIHGELHIALIIRERWIGPHIAVPFAVRRSELLEIAGDKLEQPAMIVD